MIWHSSMIAILLTILFTAFFSELFGYVVHRAMHQEWTGPLNQIHMTHHLKLYPPSDYLSDTYRNAGKDNTAKIFFLMSLPVIIGCFVLGFKGVLPFSVVLTAISVMGVMGFLHDYLHDAFHIRNHYLSRVSWFRRAFESWNYLHYIHHVHMESNYGIFLFHWDQILRTFKKDINAADNTTKGGHIP
jgi:sterol desaturase/sphingolipid hydroxylase (fatty acid hydroxylase superfamily)